MGFEAMHSTLRRTGRERHLFSQGQGELAIYTTPGGQFSSGQFIIALAKELVNKLGLGDCDRGEIVLDREKKLAGFLLNGRGAKPTVSPTGVFRYARSLTQECEELWKGWTDGILHYHHPTIEDVNGFKCLVFSFADIAQDNPGAEATPSAPNDPTPPVTTLALPEAAIAEEAPHQLPQNDPEVL